MEKIIEDQVSPQRDEGEEEGEVLFAYAKYAEKSGFRLNPAREVVEGVVKGLLKNEKKYGQRYCPCRRVVGNLEEDRLKICPCAWHREEIARNGHCQCRLFVKL